MVWELNEITDYTEPEANSTFILQVSRDWVRLTIGICLPNLSPQYAGILWVLRILQIIILSFLLSTWAS